MICFGGKYYIASATGIMQYRENVAFENILLGLFNYDDR